MGQIIIISNVQSKEEYQIIYDAVTAARSTAEKIWGAMELVWDQPGNGKEKKQKIVKAWCNTESFDIHSFRTYLGISEKNASKNNQQISFREIKKVRRKINWLKKKLLNRKLRFRIKNGDAIAYNLWFFSKIVLCPLYFKQPPIERASTIIHELLHDFPIVHGKNLFRFKDYKKSVCCTEAKKMAIQQPKKARRSSYNFEYLSQEIMAKYEIA